MKREYLNPEMSISMFERENVVTTASAAMFDVKSALTDASSGLKVNDKTLTEGQIVSITF